MTIILDWFPVKRASMDEVAYKVMNSNVPGLGHGRMGGG